MSKELFLLQATFRVKFQSIQYVTREIRHLNLPTLFLLLLLLLLLLSLLLLLLLLLMLLFETPPLPHAPFGYNENHFSI